MLKVSAVIEDPLQSAEASTEHHMTSVATGHGTIKRLQSHECDGSERACETADGSEPSVGAASDTRGKS